MLARSVEQSLEKQMNTVRLTNHRSDVDVYTLLMMYKTGTFIIQPPFQRGYVWDRRAASRLIESMLLGYQIPEIQVGRSTDPGGLLTDKVIDGQQRLTSIFGFIEGRNLWGDTAEFRLTGCEKITAINGLSFQDLPARYQTLIRGYRLHLLTAQTEDLQAIVELFKRLNTSTWKLTNQEIRNAIYCSELNQVLAELASDSRFLQLTRGKRDQRKTTAELLLRCLAFYHQGPESFVKQSKGSLKLFLDKEMEFWRKHISPEIITDIRQRFHSFFELANAILGDTAFTRVGSDNRAKISRLLVELVFWGFSRYTAAELLLRKSQIRAAYVAMQTEDARFRDAIAQQTTDTAKVLYRFSAWGTRLEAIMQNAPEPVADFVDGGMVPEEIMQYIRETMESQLPDYRVCDACKESISDEELPQAVGRYVIHKGEQHVVAEHGHACQIV